MKRREVFSVLAGGAAIAAGVKPCSSSDEVTLMLPVEGSQLEPNEVLFVGGPADGFVAEVMGNKQSIAAPVNMPHEERKYVVAQYVRSHTDPTKFLYRGCGES